MTVFLATFVPLLHKDNILLLFCNVAAVAENVNIFTYFAGLIFSYSLSLGSAQPVFAILSLKTVTLC